MATKLNSKIGKKYALQKIKKFGRTEKKQEKAANNK